MGQGVGPQGPRELEGRPMESQEVKGQASIVYYDLFHLIWIRVSHMDVSTWGLLTFFCIFGQFWHGDKETAG